MDNSFTIVCNGEQITREWGDSIAVTFTSGAIYCLKDGTFEYRNSEGKLHREDGPAIKGPGGEKFYENGKEIKKKPERQPKTKAPISDEEFLRIWTESGAMTNPDTGKAIKEGTAKWKECDAKAKRIASEKK